jgi:putative nucleotidyltransferase with HDIG domain
VNKATRDRAIGQLRSFPAMPATATNVLRLLREPDVNASDVELAIKYDPGLTANTLKLANSAYFGYPRSISSVRSAVVRLGWKRVYQLVVASCMSKLMDRPLPGYDLPPGELWRHGLAVSVAAEHLARTLNLKSSEEMFTAALLHDIGKMALGNLVDADFRQIAGAASEGLSFEAAERQVLGIDHAEIGAQVLERWNLPPELVEVARWHHDPDRASISGCVVDLVHVADVLCLVLGIGAGRDGLGYKPSSEALSRLRIEPSHLEEVGSEILQSVEEMWEILNPGAPVPV